VDKCIDSLFLQTHKVYRIVIIDNNSIDSTVEKLSRYTGIEVYCLDQNIGWVGANNIALRDIVKTEYALLLNIDTILHPDCIEKLVELGEKTDATLITPTILEYRDYPEVKPGYPLYIDLRTGTIVASESSVYDQPVTFVPGTAMFVNMKAIGDNVFRDDFFMYHEDVEFCLRLMLKGIGSMFYCGNAYIWHDSRQSYTGSHTCINAIRNLFVCLTNYQTRKSFIRNIPNYTVSFLSLYPYYGKFYPIRYPILFAKNLIVSLLRAIRMGNHGAVFEKLTKHLESELRRGANKQSFRFIF